MSDTTKAAPKPKRKGNQTSFKKGNKLARKARGKKKLTGRVYEETVVKAMDRSAFFRHTCQFTHLTVDQLKSIYKDKTARVIDQMICGVLIRMYESKDMYAFNAFLDRYIGPITQRHEVVPLKNDYDDMTDEELYAAREKMLEGVKRNIAGIEKEKAMFQLIAARDVTPESNGTTVDGTKQNSESGHDKASAG